jgi:L-threonylcarbamoyladenylate synthase
MTTIGQEVKKTVDVLKRNGIILYPTDTIWGIGGDATRVEVIEKIIALKKRSSEKNFIVLLDEAARLPSYVEDVPEIAWSLIEYATRPLTIIYDKAKNLPEEILAPDGSIAIRITRDEFCKRIIAGLRKPLISTSANLSGERPPATFEEISQDIKKGVDCVVNWRREEKSRVQPSTIIRLRGNGEIKFIRR